VFIPEGLSREQRMVLEAAQEFARKQIHPAAERIEAREEGVMRSLMRQAGELGLTGTDIPEQFGGEGMDKVSSCLVTEAFGGVGSFSVTHSAHTGIGTLPIALFGNPDQKRRYLPRLASSQWLAAYCLTEPDAGSDAMGGCRSVAELEADGRAFRLSGEKIYITNGAWADVFIVYAKVGGEHFSSFIVERGFPGLSIGAEESKMGLKGSSTTPVILKECRVPAENLLLAVGQGHKIAFNILNIGRYKLGAGTVGTCKLALAEAARYATLRVQFGKPLAQFGLIQSKLADMAIRTYLAESLVYRLAAAIEDRLVALDASERADGARVGAAIEEYAIECSIAKIFGSEGLDGCADDLVQVLGGNGFTTHYPAERIYRDSRVNRIFEGTNEINRLLIAGTLLKRTGQGRLPLLEAAANAATLLEENLRAAATGANALELAGRALAIGRGLTLMAAGAAAGLAGRLAEEQEVMGWLADLVIWSYAAESGWLRAMRTAGELHAAAVTVFLQEILPVMAGRVRQILLRCGPAESRHLELVGRAAMAIPLAAETVRLRREIAAKAIKTKKYPF
jgi:alkylation response protein AidB-like acyl-CoA dehydrogenase